MEYRIIDIFAIILMVVEALALGFLTWAWFRDKRRGEE